MTKNIYIAATSAECGCAKNKRECLEFIKDGTSLLNPSCKYKSKNGDILYTAEFDKLHTITEAMIQLVDELSSECDLDTKSEKTIFIISTTKGDIDGDNNHSAEQCIYSPSQTLVRHFDNPNKPICVSNACISGILAQELAFNLLRNSIYETAVVLGIDFLSDFIVSGFDSFNSLSKEKCKPYDANRDGICLGEAVSGIVLTTNKNIIKNKQNFIISGGGSSNDANHISGPSRTGEELALSITRATYNNNILCTVESPDLTYCHGTATLYNDGMESKALHHCGLENSNVLSTKGYTGHTLGACGVLETVLAVEFMKEEFVPSTLGFTTTDESLGINVQSKNEHRELKSIVKTASGFGGCNCTIVITKEDNQTFNSPDSDISFNIELPYKCIGEASITKGKVTKNGNIVYEDTESPYETFIKYAFHKAYDGTYIKFGKMDEFCKLGITTVEFLINGCTEIENLNRNNVCIVQTTLTGSMFTDSIHIENIKNGVQASPSVFVYTLPNIAVGEVCIRHKFKGENLTIIGDENIIDTDTLAKIYLGDCDQSALIRIDLNYESAEKYMCKAQLFVKS